MVGVTGWRSWDKRFLFIQETFSEYLIECARRWGYNDDKDIFCFQGAYHLG